MRLLETYSRNASVDIKNKPIMYEKFFALPSEITKYITIQNKSGMPAKDYLFFQDVVDIISPILEKEGIKILLLGQDAPPLNKVINLVNQTSIHQSYYLLKRSLLHLSVDSWLAHVAGAENIPLVELFGSTSVKNHSPYHYNKEKTIFLESNRNGNLPSYQVDENPRTINLIKSEDVAAAVCKLLGLEFTYPYKTRYIGEISIANMVISAMDSVINPASLGLNNIICDMTLNFNEHNLINQLNIVDCSIITNRPINLDLIKRFKPRIKEIIYSIESLEFSKPDFVKFCQKLGLSVRVISTLDMETINNLKLDWMDVSIIHKIKEFNPDAIKEFEGVDRNNLYFRSSKFYLGRGKLYPSKENYRQDKFISHFEEITPIIPNNEFFQELDSFKILSKN